LDVWTERHSIYEGLLSVADSETVAVTMRCQNLF